MAKRTNTLAKAGLAIPEVLQESKLLAPYRFFQAKRDWPELMGRQIAKYSYIKEIKDHCVIIGVLNSVWMSHLFMYQNQIRDKLNEYIGESFVHSVRFVHSGKKPAPVVYETVQGQETDEYPREPIKNMVLSDECVARIRQDTAALPDGLRDKMQALRFAQEKRHLAYAAEGFHQCPRCGRWLSKGEQICFLCRQEERQHKKQVVRDLLVQMPWLTLEQFLQEAQISDNEKLYTDLYNEVRRDCIYKLIERVYYGSDSSDDDLFLVMFITRKGPAALTEDHIRNLVNRYRKKD